MDIERIISRLRISKLSLTKYDESFSVIKKILKAQVPDRNEAIIDSIINVFEEEADYALSRFLKEMDTLIDELEKAKEVKHE